MLERGQYFAGQEIKEDVLLFIRRHKFAFIWSWGIFLAILIIIPLFIFLYVGLNFGWQMLFNRENSYFLIGLCAYFLILSTLFLSAWVSWYFDITIVTPTHLVDINQQGFFNRKVSEQSLLRVQDVSAKTTGFWQTWLKFGTVFVETAGEAPNFVIENIPDPSTAANIILKLHDELVAKGEHELEMAEGEGTLRPVSGKSEFLESGGLAESKESLAEAPEKEKRAEEIVFEKPQALEKEEPLPRPRVGAGLEPTESAPREEEEVEEPSPIEPEASEEEIPSEEEKSGGQEGEGGQEGKLTEGESVKLE